MNKKQIDLWFDDYMALDLEAKHEALMALLEKGVPDKLLKVVDFVGLISDLLYELSSNKHFEQMLEVYDKAYDIKPLLKDPYYLDSYPIDYFLYKRETSRLKRCYESYISDPVNSIDSFIPVFDKLLYYGQRSLSRKIASDVYETIKNGSGICGEPEDDFGVVVYCEYLQDIYDDLKNGRPIEKDVVIDGLKPFDFIMEPHLDSIIELLRPEGFKTLPHDDYLKDKNSFMNDLCVLFSRYMLDEKDICFSAANDIWCTAYRFFRLDKIIEKREKTETDLFFESLYWDENDDEAEEYTDEDLTDFSDHDVERNFDTVFSVDKDNFNIDISARLDMISNKKPSAFAISWGIVYVYDFLYKYGYIPQEMHADALEFFADNKGELISGFANVLWEYDFVHEWKKADSVDNAEFEAEKKLFDRSFVCRLREHH